MLTCWNSSTAAIRHSRPQELSFLSAALDGTGGVINVQAFGVVPANSAGTNDAALAAMVTTLAALPNAGTTWFTFYFPAGSYSISAKWNLSSLRLWSIVGDGAFTGNDYGSAITGTVADYMIYTIGTNGRTGLEKIRIANNSSNAAAWCVGIGDTGSSYIQNSAMSTGSGGGVDWLPPGSGGAFDSVVINTSFSGNGIGIGLQTPTLVTGCAFVGCGEGIRAFGASGCISGNRFEVNAIGIRAGVDATGR